MSESARSGSIVGSLWSSDANGDPISYGLDSGATTIFHIENGRLILDGALDFEQKSFYELDVSAWDGKGGISRSHVRINVTDVIGETSTARLGGAKVLGNKGKDRISGNIDGDTLRGSLDNDTLTGGAGRDTFLFDTSPGKTNVDRIMDFQPKQDHIQLEDAIFRKVGKVGVLKKGAFWTGDKAHDRDDRIIYNKKTGALYYDADGNGKVAAVKFAELSKKLALKHTDFLIA